MSFIFLFLSLVRAIDLPELPAGYSAPGLPVGPPVPPPAYMVNNQGNTFGVAPDKGVLNGPVTTQTNLTVLQDSQISKRAACASSSYWLANIDHGSMPFAPDGYQFYRNVCDFGATGDGVTDDTEAINKAISSGGRCGQECGSTTALGALVYFPPGTYMISSPLIQYYFTQFVGDAVTKPTIKGMQNFTGIALIDNDVYIPGGNGDEWYINQNQFYRQIRNFVIDLTEMNRTNYENDQEYVPTGIHWQVAQATSLQNIDFVMPVSDSSGATTAVGIFMENGSGGNMQDLTFFGGNIGFRAGSQQFTARNLTFTSCLVAISMIWDWGFTWKSIYVYSCYIALDCTNFGGIDGQGTGSIAVLDSHFNGVPYAITTLDTDFTPNIVLDNLLVENSASIVLISGGATIYPGSVGQVYIESWATGNRYTSTDGSGGFRTGLVNPSPIKSGNLLNDAGKIYERSKPQYESLGSGSFIVATANGIKNDATGDQTDAINSLLSNSVGTPVFFPAGIYLVEGTVFVPVGSIIVGEAWSQIMGTGSYFQDETDPKVMVQVGNAGDEGVIEISDMLFTVKGPTAGAILMEWNIHESSQGSAGMWDSHFRVGGALGTNLQLADCPKLTGSVNKDCMAASMMLHMTSESSAYLETIWAWVADHDIDEPPNGNTTTSTQINIYVARGVLIESQGPTWLYGTASEHSILYQYQLSGAQNIYLGHIQTETPYFQANPDASQPYTLGTFPNDPLFSDCDGGSCEEAFALRVLYSQDVFIYSAGFYSFFQDYSQDCIATQSCQQKLFETSYSQGLWVYNLFTIGTVEVVSPRGLTPLLQADTGQNGYTTEVSVWLPLALTGTDIGSGEDEEISGSGDVYIDPIIFIEPSPVVQCWPPCVIVYPPSTMPTPTIFVFPPISTSIVIGGSTVTSISVPPVTTSVVSFWDQTIEQGQSSFTYALTSSLKQTPFPITVGGIITTIIPHPTSALPSTSSVISYASLPTTVITTNGLTLTYSEAQFTDLATISAQTTVTTDLVETYSGQTSSSSTTVVPIWVQVGGFCWSPVPLPTSPPIPVPILPSFPSVPSPPCFKIFDIFSIDCPPDKSKPTTTFKPGPNKPTCTANCGKKCTVDCETDGSPTSTQGPSSDCETQTNTACRTICTATPCVTSCNTYIGCECATSTVTDYWVSCTDFSSCTTTSSAVITGCYVTATATTTGDYCPATLAVSPDDDEGDDAPGDSPSYITVTNSESLGISDTWYPVNSGTVVVGGNILTVPNVAVSTVTVIIGTTVTLLPSSTGVAVSIPASILSSISFISTGVSTSSSEPTSVSSGLPYPTSTDPGEGPALCFEAYNDDGFYQEFAVIEGEETVNVFCGRQLEITPGDPSSYNATYDTGPYTVVAAMQWADNQDGCGEELSNNLGAPGCSPTFDNDYSYCTVASSRTYGGAYVFNTGEGCILVELYAIAS